MSQHKIEVVPIVLEKHENADSLSIVRVWGFTCCVRTADFQGVSVGAYIQGVSIGAYIPPDSLVDPARPEFSFLKGKSEKNFQGKKWSRIMVSKLRGVVSQGLLVPAKPHWKIGDDVAVELGIEHYDPPIQMFGPRAHRDGAPSPKIIAPSYDVENFRRYPNLFFPGEMVVATEKIHGANARYVYVDGQIHCGSRNGWKKEDQASPWWIALKRTPELLKFCEDNPGIVVYGEIFGRVQNLRYDSTPSDPVKFIAFDILSREEFLSYKCAREVGKDLPWVPEVYRGPFSPDIEKYAEGQSLIPGANHIREGIVVKPIEERWDEEIGRVQLKIVSNSYLGVVD